MTTGTDRSTTLAMQRLETLATENETLREKLRSVSDRLSNAETVLRFYSDPRNFEARRNADGATVSQNILKNDFSTADNDRNTKLAGRRAREYFKAYDKQD